jgi:hypothetical protein
MISRAKQYFSFFGMLSMSVDIKTNALYSAISELAKHTTQIVLKLQKELLQPTYTQSTNQI